MQQHPADIATLLNRLDEEYQIILLKKLPEDLCSEVFEKLPEKLQATLIVELDKKLATYILKKMPADKVTDFFDHLSDEQLKECLALLQKEHRNRVISLLSFPPESAGGIMDSEVLTLPEDITIKKSITLLQRLRPEREHLERIYITNKENKLVGYINIGELVLNKPETPIANITHKNELIIDVHEDQEAVANQMQHYELLSVPVVDKYHHFLGIITADDVLEIIQKEASEDVYKISGLALEHKYFQTPFWRLIWQRSFWLIPLLIMQSISSFVLSNYQTLIAQHAILVFFLNMLIGTGGNAGNQSGALVIRGLSIGEITRKNGFKLLFRELRISIIIAILLSAIGFVRVYLTKTDFITALAISTSLSLIIVVSILLGTLLPLIFERLNIDPAHSAAPFLATLMDIIGIIIYCIVSSKILS